MEKRFLKAKMNSQKDPNNEVDLSKFFDRQTAGSELRPATIKQIEDPRITGGKKQASLIWVVVVNFVIGSAIFSYYIIKSNEAALVKPASLQNTTAPVNYPENLKDTYMPPLP